MTGSKHETKARRSCTQTSPMKQEYKGSKLKMVQSLAKWLTIETNAILQERIQNHLSVHVPSLNAPKCHT